MIRHRYFLYGYMIMCVSCFWISYRAEKIEVAHGFTLAAFTFACCVVQRLFSKIEDLEDEVETLKMERNPDDDTADPVRKNVDS